MFLIGLGNLGKYNLKEAEEAFKQVTGLDPAHSEAKRLVNVRVRT